MSRENKVWFVVLGVVLGLVAALAFHSLEPLPGMQGYPRNTFLFSPDVRWSDFFVILHPVRQFDPYSARPFVYFPFTYVPMLLFTPFSDRVALGLYCAIFAGSISGFVYRQLEFLPRARRLLATTALSFLTYPFLFCVDRGNVEALVFTFLVVFFLTFETRWRRLAVVCLAAAGAMKLYPAVFALLYLSRKRYREFVATGLLVAVFTVVSASLLPGGLHRSAALLSENLRSFTESTILGDDGLRFNSSLFAVMKIVMGGGEAASRIDVQEYLMVPYSQIAVVLGAVAAWYVVRRERDLWKQAAILTFMTLLLPQLSYDYKLIHLVIPLGLFLSVRGENARRDAAYLALFTLLLIPLAYVWIRRDINIGTLIRPLLMIVMAVAFFTEARRTSTGVDPTPPR